MQTPRFLRRAALALTFALSMAAMPAAQAQGELGYTTVAPVLVRPARPYYVPRAVPLVAPPFVQPPVDELGYVAPLHVPPLYANTQSYHVLPAPQLSVYPGGYVVPLRRGHYTDERRFDDTAPWDQRDQTERRWRNPDRYDGYGGRHDGGYRGGYGYPR